MTFLTTGRVYLPSRKLDPICEVAKHLELSITPCIHNTLIQICGYFHQRLVNIHKQLMGFTKKSLCTHVYTRQDTKHTCTHFTQTKPFPPETDEDQANIPIIVNKNMNKLLRLRHFFCNVMEIIAQTYVAICKF